MTSVRVLLAEDHRLVRAGIHALLDRMAGVEVVGEVSDGMEALKVVEAMFVRSPASVETAYTVWLPAARMPML